MKICGISDMHGQLSFKVEPCDVLCICGDIVPLNIQSNTVKTLNWIEREFKPWCSEQPCKNILLIGGNHDICFEHNEEEMKYIFRNTKVKYLVDETYEYTDEESGKIYKFYGSPWCHIFGHWAFMIPDEAIAEKLKNMPNDIDVLLTHDAPYGTSDVLQQNVPWNTHDHIGCKPIADAVIEKQPKVHLKGHLHSTNHECEMLGDTKVYTVSLLDEKYQLVYEPLYLDI